MVNFKSKKMCRRDRGYIKRTPLSEYKVQNRGGVGSKGSATRDEDFLEHMIMATMHNTMSVSYTHL